MGENTRIYDRFEFWSVADCSCEFCVNFHGKCRPCPLEVLLHRGYPSRGRTVRTSYPQRCFGRALMHFFSLSVRLRNKQLYKNKYKNIKGASIPSLCGGPPLFFVFSNAVKSLELASRFGITGRALRDIVSELRCKGHPICNDDYEYYYRGGADGYHPAAMQQDQQDSEGEERSRPRDGETRAQRSDSPPAVTRKRPAGGDGLLTALCHGSAARKPCGS